MRPPELIARLVPFFFGCVGITVIVFLWSQPFGQFGSPPLFFRIVGSFIGIIFVAVGFGGAFFGASQAKLMDRLRSIRPGGNPQWRGHKGASSYICPGCSAPLKEGADVSQSGDVKCTY